jgi:hypothetical protein
MVVVQVLHRRAARHGGAPAVAVEDPVPLGDLPVEGAPAERALSSMTPRAYPAVGKSLRPPPPCGAPIPRRDKAGDPLQGSSAAHRFPGRAGAGIPVPGSLCGAPISRSSRAGIPFPGPCAAHRFPGRAEVVSSATTGRPARLGLLRTGIGARSLTHGNGRRAPFPSGGPSGWPDLVRRRPHDISCREGAAVATTTPGMRYSLTCGAIASRMRLPTPTLCVRRWASPSKEPKTRPLATTSACWTAKR